MVVSRHRWGLIACVMGALWGTSPALAAPMARSVATDGALVLAAAGQRRCVGLQRSGRGEVLFNGCGACRTVEVERRRPGMETPTERNYVLPAGTRQPLSFRGPGSTRLRGEKPCDAKTAPRHGTQAAAQCISVQRTEKVGTVMLNSCGVCRRVVVARFGADGGSRERSYVVRAHDYLPLRAEGARRASIVHDLPCE